jgi:hypothetical protein
MKKIAALLAASLLLVACSTTMSEEEREREERERLHLTDAQIPAHLNDCFDFLTSYPWREGGKCARYDVEKSTRRYTDVVLHVDDSCANDPMLTPVSEKFRVYRDGHVEYWEASRSRFEPYIGCREDQRREREGEEEHEKLLPPKQPAGGS